MSALVNVVMIYFTWCQLNVKNVLLVNYESNLSQYDINHAYLTMNYHRSMLREYQCQSFLANKILEDLTMKIQADGAFTDDEGNVATPYEIKRRNGRASNESDARFSNKYGKYITLPNHTNILESPENTPQITYYKPPFPDENTDRGFIPSIYTTEAPHYYQYYYDHNHEKHHHESQPEINNDSGSEEGDSQSEEETEREQNEERFELVLTTMAFVTFGAFVTNLIVALAQVNQDGTTLVMKIENNNDGNNEEAKYKRKKPKRSAFHADTNIHSVQLNELSQFISESIKYFANNQRVKVNDTCVNFKTFANQKIN